MGGSRVEALFEGAWYAATLIGLPYDDPKDMGRWKVHCDIDPADTLAYVCHIRALEVADVSAVAFLGEATNSTHVALECEVKVGSRMEAFLVDTWCQATVVKLP